MPRLAVIATSLVFVALPGCAGEAGGYRPHDGTSGFSEQAVGDDQWAVAYEGTATTSDRRAMELARRRAAEVALDNGASYFRITNVTRLDRVEARRVPSGHASGRRDTFGSLDDGRIPAADTQAVEIPVVELTIELLREPAPGAIDARELLGAGR